MEIIHFLDDIDQPYSCTQWGNEGSIGIPPIVDDGTINTIFNWFNNPNGSGIYPLIIFIDHTMEIISIAGSSPSFFNANFIIDAMLENLPEMSIAISNDILILNNFQLTRFYPNPFNPILNITFDIAWSGVIHVDILDISGSHLETLYAGYLQSGSHELSWNAESMPSGMYLVSLKSSDYSLIEKVVLLK